MRVFQRLLSRLRNPDLNNRIPTSLSHPFAQLTPWYDFTQKERPMTMNNLLKSVLKTMVFLFDQTEGMAGERP